MLGAFAPRGWVAGAFAARILAARGGVVGAVPARVWMVGAVGAIVLLAGPGPAVAQATTTATATFTVPGEHQFTVPSGVASITVKAVGAAGGGCRVLTPYGVFPKGGAGAEVTATVPVSPAEQLLVSVGGPGGPCGNPNPGGAGGTGGGGSGGSGSGRRDFYVGGAGGGGASLVGIAPLSPGFGGPLVVAGGGGGSAYDADGGPSGSPGQWRPAGSPGQGPTPGAAPGQPGTITGPGAGGGGGASGSLGFGGAGGGCDPASAEAGGGGGGGGYYGGGGGGCGLSAAGGGGGASFIGPAASNMSAVLTNLSPVVSITYSVPTADLSATALHFGTQTPGTAGPAQALKVTNKGSAPLVVSGALLGGSDPGDFLVVDRCQQPVPVGSSCELGVRFLPQVAGARSARLTLLTNAPTAPADVSLSGGPATAEVLICRPIAADFTASARTELDSSEETCTGRLIRGPVKLPPTGASTPAALDRGAAVYAIGESFPTARGGSELVLTDRHPLKHGAYTLVLSRRRGRRWSTRRLTIIVG